ncbi:Holliday junction branch migration protein RuvA [Candidatus Deianiraea vastatrix]|uniref:Holliday junction branch migration complex subunit RuvA n=1 Tax=Candidatus Deianiraea vastatrix TaxID=2163644 RepID=A0A5B8XDF2_9RICK|nr:Holliday junction branch migration protein RuvA [Candidatus Deianiraea vastatrix]QED22915.1 Holliday junction ATP-dependent DNA helicase RuvA [Candidatus Deianiraea vastatrix]
MIAKLIGKVHEVCEDRVLLDVSGVIYEIICPRSTLTNITCGVQICLEIVHIFREDGQFLYGFSTKDEKFWFLELTKISGLGPKFAISVLSTLTVDEIYSGILSQDEKLFAKANGVGAKLATRIVTEMQSVLKKIGTQSVNNVKSVSSVQAKNSKNNSLLEATDALVALGFQKSQVYQIISKKFAEDGEISTEDLIKFYLSSVAMK